MTVEITGLGGRPGAVPEEDRDDLPDIGAAFNLQACGAATSGRLAVQGLDLDV